MDEHTTLTPISWEVAVHESQEHERRCGCSQENDQPFGCSCGTSRLVVCENGEVIFMASFGEPCECLLKMRRQLGMR